VMAFSPTIHFSYSSVLPNNIMHRITFGGSDEKIT
jgi:hypothetical protein